MNYQTNPQLSVESQMNNHLATAIQTIGVNPFSTTAAKSSLAENTEEEKQATKNTYKKIHKSKQYT